MKCWSKGREGGGIDGCPDKLSTGDTASISSADAVSGILSADCYGTRDVICRSVHSAGPNLVTVT